jgi:RNA polymerase sigma factor (sigma-70 family)
MSKMNSCLPNSIDSRSGGGRFEQTQWTIILRARVDDAPGAADAMEAFARIYWPPIYRYIRREGYSPHDAQDLTQGFYAHFLEKQLLDRVGERTGKFRNYLLTCLKHFLSDERDRAQALKRLPKGGFISRDAMEAEERDALEPSDSLTPDEIYGRRWARAIRERAQERLRGQYEAKGKATLYEALKGLLLGEKTETSYAEIARGLGTSEQAIKSAAKLLREKFFQILRKEIERTVGSPGEIDEEIRHLIVVLGR